MATRPFANNPGFLPADELKRSFVVHRPDLALLLELLRDQGSGPNQHVLIVGPKGMGKTTLVRALVAEIADDAELGAKWLPVVFSHEVPAVTSVGELWLEAIRTLADVDDEVRWKAVYDRLLDERDDRRLRERALEQLRSFSEEAGRRLLFVIENMNVLLGEQLSDDDAWTLRHTLLNEERFMLVGTATTRIDAIDNVEKAMFELFKIHRLAPLDADGCRDLYQAISDVRLEGRRIRPVQLWTGGNPRFVSMMAWFARQIPRPTLTENLQRLVDEHTPFFKSTLEALPTLERKVYISLAELWGWSTAREVARRARIDVNKASSYLGRLESRRAVDSRRDGRAKSYRVSERLFVLYLLLRSPRGQAKRLRSLLEFMEAFYAPDSQEQVAQVLESAGDGRGPEPVLVARQMAAGKEVEVPEELRRVAEDVRDYLDEMSGG